MKSTNLTAWLQFAGIPVLIAVVGASFLLGRKLALHPENQRPGKFPEQLVYIRSQNEVVDAGALFAPPKDLAKPLAVIWVHGWGANFYSPSYVGIGRALAERGFLTISVNTRMHDIGNVEKHTLLGKRVRGGGYWGVTSEDAHDIAAWIDYAEQLGYSRVVLVGHSAGWASVGRYQADSEDHRVAGLVFASPGVGYSAEPDVVEEAPEIFLPIPGGWGKMGHTHIRLAVAREDVLRGALRTAWKLRLDKNATTSRKKPCGGAQRSNR